MKIEGIYSVNLLDLCQILYTAKKQNYATRTFQQNVNYYMSIVSITFELMDISGGDILFLKEFASKLDIEQQQFSAHTEKNFPEDIKMIFKKAGNLIENDPISGCKYRITSDYRAPIGCIYFNATAVFKRSNILNLIGMDFIDKYDFSFLDDGSMSDIDKENKILRDYIMPLFYQKFAEFKKMKLTSQDIFTDAVIYNEFYSQSKLSNITSDEASATIAMIHDDKCVAKFIGGNPNDVFENLKIMNKEKAKFVFVIHSNLMTRMFFELYTDFVINKESYLMLPNHIKQPIQTGRSNEISPLQASLIEDCEKVISFVVSQKLPSSELEVDGASEKLSIYDMMDFIPGTTSTYFMVSFTLKEFEDLFPTGIDFIRPICYVQDSLNPFLESLHELMKKIFEIS